MGRVPPTVATPGRAPTVDRRTVAALHRRVLSELAAAGDWWDGVSRRAIMEEARRAWRCVRCLEQRAPSGSFSGGHDGSGVLPAAAVEVIHRVVNDSGRLTRQWADVQIEELGDASYAEVVGVTATVVAMDVYARSMGDPPHELLPPVAGPPAARTSRRRRRCRGVDPDDRGEAAGERVPCAVAGAAHQRDVAHPRERVLQPRARDARPDVGSRADPPPGRAHRGRRSRCSRSASIERRATRRCSVRAAQRSDPRSTYGRPSNAASGSPTAGPSSTSPLPLTATGPIWRPPAGPSSPLSALPVSLRRA